MTDARPWLRWLVRVVVGGAAAWSLLLWAGLFFVVPLIGDGPGPDVPPPALAALVETFVVTLVASLVAGVSAIALSWAVRQHVPRRARWLYPAITTTAALLSVTVAELT